MNLSEFLLARIAEDVDILTRPESYQHSSHGYDAPGTYSPTCRTCRQMVWGTRERALAECEAKRRIVEHHGSNGDEWPLCVICTEVGPNAQGWPCLTLQLLALPYADHPDYRDEWRP